VKNLDDTPMYLATRIGCSNQNGETDWLVETVRHLVAAGADLAIEDDNHNTALLFAADECGPRIVTLLAEGGAKVNARNGLRPDAAGLRLHERQARQRRGARSPRAPA
jgi:hypothetical protein